MRGDDVGTRTDHVIGELVGPDRVEAASYRSILLIRLEVVKGKCVLGTATDLIRQSHAEH